MGTEKKPKVGDLIKTWFSKDKTKCSRVLGVRPYDGLYKKEFKWVVKLTAPATMSGYLEMAM
jgi:hypothetical protein